MRLIDGDSLCRSLVDWMFESFGKDDGHDVEFEPINKVVAGIDAHPTIDAVPVVHGEWTVSRTDYGWNCVEFPTHCKCSQCGREIPYQDKDNFCPNCGAKMDGGADNG